MTKKILRILAIILLVGVLFFIKISYVGAVKTTRLPKDTYYSCKYFAPLTFIDTSNRAANITISLTYPLGRKEQHYLPLSCSEWFTYITRPVNVRGFCLVDSEDGNVGFQTDPSLVEVEDVGDDPYYLTEINQNIFVLDEKLSNLNDFGDADYVKLVVEDSEYKLVSSTEDEYRYYLSNQYKGLETNADNYTLYDVMNIDKISLDPRDNGSGKAFGWGNNAFVCDEAEKVRGLPALHDANSNFKNYVEYSGGIVFSNPTKSAKYPTTNKDRFDTLLKEQTCDEGKKNCKDLFDSDTQEKAKTGLSILIDLNEYDSKTGSSIFYEATKDKWYEYMMEDLEKPKKASAIRKEYFSKWFNMVSRYIFEEDEQMEMFKKYFNYICENPEGVVEGFDSSYCESINKVVSAMLTHKKAEEKLVELDSDPCAAICPACAKKNYYYMSCEASCRDKKRELFEKCSECIGKTTEDEKKKCMGDKYNDIMAAIDKAKSDTEKEKQDAAKAAVSAALELYEIGIADPQRLNIQFGKRANIKCSDVKVFHDIYMLIIILAPILTIVMGSIDFLKALLASDEKKMAEFKKKFPKRLIMLFLLILVPLIISFLTSNVAGLDNSVMGYIINGC